MKCQNFEATIHNLARGQLVEVSVREQTLAHIEQCAHCADVYADQCVVVAGVRAVTESLADKEASAQVEMALRRAFREQAGRRSAPAVGPRLTWQPWRRRAIGAAIAAIILLALLTGLRSLKPPTADSRQEAHYQNSNPASKSASPSASPTSLSEAPALNVATNSHEQKPAHEFAGVRHPKTHRTQSQRFAPEAEVATSFYPLVEEDELVRLESGQVVRIEVPVSTLIALGLPISAESRNRSVQADLLLGQDGVARAIRFLP